MRIILTSFGAKGVLYAAGPVRPALSTPGELPPARLVILEQIPYALCRAQRGVTLIVQTEQALAHFPLQLLATDNGLAPYHQRAPRGGCCLGGGRHSPVHRVSGSEPRRLRTHRLSGRSRPLRSSDIE